MKKMDKKLNIVQNIKLIIVKVLLYQLKMEKINLYVMNVQMVNN